MYVCLSVCLSSSITFSSYFYFLFLLFQVITFILTHKYFLPSTSYSFDLTFPFQFDLISFIIILYFCSFGLIIRFLFDFCFFWMIFLSILIFSFFRVDRLLLSIWSSSLMLIFNIFVCELTFFIFRSDLYFLYVHFSFFFLLVLLIFLLPFFVHTLFLEGRINLQNNFCQEKDVPIHLSNTSSQ